MYFLRGFGLSGTIVLTNSETVGSQPERAGRARSIFANTAPVRVNREKSPSRNTCLFDAVSLPCNSCLLLFSPRFRPGASTLAGEPILGLIPSGLSESQFFVSFLQRRTIPHWKSTTILSRLSLAAYPFLIYAPDFASSRRNHAPLMQQFETACSTNSCPHSCTLAPHVLR